MFTGDDRRLYQACDAIADAVKFDPREAERLDAMAGGGLMLRDGGKFLSLAVPLGDYQPSGAAAARLRSMMASAGTPTKDGVRIALDENHGVAAPTSRRRAAGAARHSSAPLTRAHFELTGAGELFVRRRVG
jgi:hypothetical protein